MLGDNQKGKTVRKTVYALALEAVFVFIIQLSGVLDIPGWFGLLIAAVVVSPVTIVIYKRRWVASQLSTIVEYLEPAAKTDDGAGDDDPVAASRTVDQSSGQLTDGGQTEIDTSFASTLRQMGIVDGSEQLKDSKYEPKPVMSQTKHGLRFLGCLGTKWVANGTPRVKFDEMLQTVGQKGGTVRFLLLDPHSEGADQLRQKVANPKGVNPSHFQYYRDFCEEYDHFEVRLYERLPRFRLIFADEFLAVAPYSYAEESERNSEQGWKDPHIEIDEDVNVELYLAFSDYYDHLWEEATPLTEYSEWAETRMTEQTL